MLLGLCIVVSAIYRIVVVNAIYSYAHLGVCVGYASAVLPNANAAMPSLEPGRAGRRLVNVLE